MFVLSQPMCHALHHDLNQKQLGDQDNVFIPDACHQCRLVRNHALSCRLQIAAHFERRVGQYSAIRAPLLL